MIEIRDVKKIRVTGSTVVGGYGVAMGNFAVYDISNQLIPITITTNGATSGKALTTYNNESINTTIRASSRWANGSYWYCTYALISVRGTWLSQGTNAWWEIEWAKPITLSKVNWNSGNDSRWRNITTTWKLDVYSSASIATPATSIPNVSVAGTQGVQNDAGQFLTSYIILKRDDKYYYRPKGVS